MKAGFIAALMFAASLTVAPLAHAETLAYPNADAASFVIDYPGSWEMTPGESVGDYLTLISPNGVTLMLRTIPGESDDIQQAVKDSIEYVRENYTDVELADPKESEHRGLKGFYLNGTATDSDIGSVRLGMAWYQLNDGTIGEIWFVGSSEDAEGIDEAAAILESLRSP